MYEVRLLGYSTSRMGQFAGRWNRIWRHANPISTVCFDFSAITFIFSTCGGVEHWFLGHVWMGMGTGVGTKGDGTKEDTTSTSILRRRSGSWASCPTQRLHCNMLFMCSNWLICMHISPAMQFSIVLIRTVLDPTPALIACQSSPTSWKHQHLEGSVGSFPTGGADTGFHHCPSQTLANGLSLHGRYVNEHSLTI